VASLKDSVVFYLRVADFGSIPESRKPLAAIEVTATMRSWISGISGAAYEES